MSPHAARTQTRVGVSGYCPQPSLCISVCSGLQTQVIQEFQNRIIKITDSSYPLLADANATVRSSSCTGRFSRAETEPLFSA